MGKRKVERRADPDFMVYYARVSEIGPCDGKECPPENHEGDWVLGISVGDNCITLDPALEKELLEKLLNAYATRARPGLKVAKDCGAKGELSKEGTPEILERCLQDYVIS